MAKSFVVTNRKRLDAFLDQAGRLDDLSVQVGIVGNARYPKGHVGSKSRRPRPNRVRPKGTTRRAAVSQLRRQLATLGSGDRAAATKLIRQEFRNRGESTKGLTTQRKGTAVARVAGVLASVDQYHRQGIVVNAPRREGLMAALWLDILNGRSPARGLQRVGKAAKADVRTRYRAEGHPDTGRMMRNIQFLIKSVSGEKAFKRTQKVRRALARKQRKARGFARKRQTAGRKLKRGLARAAKSVRRRR